MTDALKAWSVTLSFAAPGPLHANMLLAPDAASVAATAMHVFMMHTPTTEPLQAVIAAEIPAETLRHMLRAVEGKLPASGNAQVVSLVPKTNELKVCRHFPSYPNCSCDAGSCVMLCSPANPAGLEWQSPLVPGAPQQALAPDDVRLGPHRRLSEDRVCVFGPPMPSGNF